MRFATVFLAGLLAACVSTSGPYPPVPAPLADARPLPPVSGEVLSWQPGHWNWDGRAYTWAAGMYIPAAGHGPIWVKEYWNLTNGVWEWQPGHWSG